MRGRVLRRGGARPAVALVVGRRPARAELGQLRALARLPRPHAGGHDAFWNNRHGTLRVALDKKVHMKIKVLLRFISLNNHGICF